MTTADGGFGDRTYVTSFKKSDADYLCGREVFRMMDTTMQMAGVRVHEHWWPHNSH